MRGWRNFWAGAFVILAACIFSAPRIREAFFAHDWSGVLIVAGIFTGLAGGVLGLAYLRRWPRVQRTIFWALMVYIFGGWAIYLLRSWLFKVTTF